MSLNRIWIPSPNYSSRGGTAVRLIVLHTAEGARTIEDLGHFFQGRVQASSHVGADDTPNTIGEYVKRENKAWTESTFNSESVSIEQCAFASWSRDEWMHHPNLLSNCAMWIAEEAAHYKLPIKKLTPSEAQGSGRGVCQHVDLGTAGGGHHDCGPWFPIDYVLTMAHGTSPAPSQKEDHLVASALSHSGALHFFELKDDYIWYTWQRKGETSWNGGKAGGNIAGMSRFAEAKGVVSIAAETSSDGTIHLFARKSDGSTLFTYQKPNSSAWAGGEPGKHIASLRVFASAP